MADVVTCLKNVVGITNKNCPCIGGSKPSDAATSSSTRFMDDLEDGIPLHIPSTVQDCESTSWQIIEQAREEGIKEFLIDFAGALGEHYRRRHDQSVQVIGDYSKATGINPLQGTYHYVKLDFKVQSENLSYILRKIKIWVDTAGTYNWYLYKSGNNLITSGSQASSPHSYKHLVTIDLSAEEELETSNGYDYYIAYETNGAYAVNSDFSCGCSGKKPQWMAYLDASAGTVTDLATLDDASPQTSGSLGIQLDGYIKCNAFGFLCEDMDFITDPFAAVVAKTIQLYSVRKLIAYTLADRSKINVYTTVLAPELEAKAAMLNEKIAARMPYLIQEVPNGINECYYCHNKFYNKQTLKI